MKKDTKDIIIVISLLAVSVLAIAALACEEPPIKGTKTDTVAKIGYGGLDNMTGVIILTNDSKYEESGNKSGNVRYYVAYTFNKVDTKLTKLLEDARNNQKSVKIYYVRDIRLFLPKEVDGLIVRAEYTNVTDK
jgi:hypothetical protein